MTAMVAHTRSLRLIRELASHGVSIVFANPGTTEMWLVSALDSDQSCGGPIRPVLCLHETVAAGAADGYARMARLPAAMLVHLGPGLANSLSQLHNAHRAGSPVVCLVGDMATWHVDADPVLAMDIHKLASTVSCAVATLTTTARAATDIQHRMNTGELVQLVHSRTRPLPVGSLDSAATCWNVTSGLPNSKVITMVIPHDLSWEMCSEAVLPSISMHEQTPVPSLPPAVSDFIQQCAAALTATPHGSSALYLGGEALLAADGALHHAGLVAAACGSELWCENAFARVDRGAGLPHLRRLPYFPQEALRALSKYEMVVVLDARLPVANFGYKDAPSQLMPDKLLAKDAVWEIDPKALQAGSVDSAVSIAACLEALACAVGAIQRITPGTNCGGIFSRLERPRLPDPGVKLSPAVLCQCVAALQPEGCILVDESLTSGGSYWDLAQGCPAFSHLTLTGGAIGSGPPLALGAALACPDRCIINLQADGSALYSTQALWSQAREQLKVVTLICQNDSYNILRVECARQQIAAAGKATRCLTTLDQPRVDWVSLAQGLGVPACSVASAGQFASSLTRALQGVGPTVIVALL